MRLRRGKVVVSLVSCPFLQETVRLEATRDCCCCGWCSTVVETLGYDRGWPELCFRGLLWLKFHDTTEGLLPLWSQVRTLWLLIWWPLKAYMVVNFRVCGINRDVRKITQTPTLIRKKDIVRSNILIYLCLLIFSVLFLVIIYNYLFIYYIDNSQFI